MRAIAKGNEPPSLTTHRLTPHCDYDNYAAKDDLRQTLVTEQRGLCCYCHGADPEWAGHHENRALAEPERYQAEQLSYRNLLGACLGGQGQPWHLQHCDTRKADRDLLWNPADPAHHVETRVQYEMDGTIRADDAVFDDHLNDVLNLNLPQIKNNRKGVLSALLDWWRAEKPIPRARIEREIQGRRGGAGELAPYCQVAVWWLQQKLTRTA